MIQIKFRAWDEKNKTMWYPIALVQNEDNEPLKVAETWYGYEIQGTHEDLIIFTTGILDKYKKDIYLGDIVEFVSLDKRVIISEVVWVRGGYFVTSDYGVLELLADQDISTLKIIGNKFENKELLNGN